uniref:Uncharacterized protein n=1 Tax=Anguilla anguilla TaxID=7936 RepID=A0A0E9XBG3_ANGAN
MRKEEKKKSHALYLLLKTQLIILKVVSAGNATWKGCKLIYYNKDMGFFFFWFFLHHCGPEYMKILIFCLAGLELEMLLILY